MELPGAFGSSSSDFSARCGSVEVTTGGKERSGPY